MAYIDSELAKRRAEGAQTHVQAVRRDAEIESSNSAAVVREGRQEVEIQRQPAALGKLLEIDLGDEARSRNVERTEQARRRLDGEEIEEESVPNGKPKKVRLGRDGKPWRGRKRRASEDVKRDKLVEDILRENRCKSPIVPARLKDTDVLQWIFMRSLLWSLRSSTMTKLRMIGLRKLLGKSLWMLFLQDRERKPLHLHLLREQRVERRKKRL